MISHIKLYQDYCYTTRALRLKELDQETDRVEGTALIKLEKDAEDFARVPKSGQIGK